ncbi:hypothetical protein [Ktedonospora formicarum]|uniref:Uncharacterized protein n=1 Tax=Ktedonospora formicarum TaxID=2778364 RepID=A0A8J3HZ91_9CHLR|nr:hypothetical protein [Ktedonospora formicarum]GHO44716.1 hypothetical protein KSX_28790 [Ktedonospora formicarum]
MDPRNDPFQPKHIDEHIEWLAQQGQEETSDGHQSARLVQRLQHYYEEKKQQDTLERAWEHIARKYDESLLSSSEGESISHEQKKNERIELQIMQQNIVKVTPMRNIFRGWGALIAAAVLVVLVASTAVIMSRATQLKGGPGAGGQPSICVSTPTTSTSTTCATPTAPTSTPQPALTPTTPALTPTAPEVTPPPILTPTAPGVTPPPVLTPTAPVVTPTHR